MTSSMVLPLSVRAEKLDNTFDWIDFPLNKDEMDEVKKHFGENPAIVVYDAYPYDLTKFGFDEHTPLWQIQLASIAAVCSEEQFDRLDDMFENDMLEYPATPLEYVNLMLQVKEIPYHDYDVPEDEDVLVTTSEESFGYSLATKLGLLKDLKRDKMLKYFDFGAYGHDHAHGMCLGFDGFVDLNDPMPRYNRYTWEEAADKLKEVAWA